MTAGQPVRRAPVVGVRPTRHSRTSVMAAAANVDGTWEFIWRTLVESRVKSVPPAEAKAMVDSGEWVLVDVRPTEDFNKAHIQGAVSCPLFLKVTRENFAPSDFLKVRSAHRFTQLHAAQRPSKLPLQSLVVYHLHHPPRYCPHSRWC